MHLGFEKIDEYLSKYDNFIISTHESPDGDGLGAEIAFNELLINLGKKTIIINSDPTPDKFEFIDIDREINVINKNGFELPDNIEDYALFVLDTNDFSNTGIAYSLIKDRVKDCFIIDHHEGGNDKFDSHFIQASASSASELIYTIIMHRKQPISFKAAQALYTGILFDTGSFRYPKTTDTTFNTAAHLVQIGVKPNKVFENVYENNSLESFILRGLMLSTMEIFHDGRMVVMKLTPEMILNSGAPFSEGEININLPLTIKGVEASMLIKQDVEGLVKVSMRTKGDLDVAELAMKNGGGGHKNAAGFKSKLSFDETYRVAIQNMEKFFL